jgi:hypothetical protein
MECAMAGRTFGDVGGRAGIARGVLRRAVARSIAQREMQSRRRINAYLLGLDDAGLATVACDRRAIEEAGQGRFPL